MDVKLTMPPREFKVGAKKKITLKDCAHIKLSDDEQVTFTTDLKTEYDVVRKSWGYYATPSLNGRLKNFGLRAVLVKGMEEKYFVLLVDKGKEKDFKEYVHEESLVIVCWLDDQPTLEKITQSFK